jgi:hypothetical protein
VALSPLHLVDPSSKPHISLYYAFKKNLMGY